MHFFSPVFFDVPSFLKLRENILRLLPAGHSANFHLLDDSAGGDPAVRGISLADVSVVTMPFNLGHQRAIVHGLRQFFSGPRREGIVVTMDSDGEDRPEDLVALLAEFSQFENDRPIVLARRTSRSESLFFKTFYQLYRWVYRLLTGTVIQTGNYAVLHPATIARIVFHPYFDLAYASTLFAIGTHLHFVPCPRGTRYEGRSKMNFSKLAIHGVRMLMPFMDRIAVRGVVAFSLFFALSTLACLGLAGAHVFGVLTIPSWVLVAALLSFVMSFLSICNFAILITVFANVQGMAMARLESSHPERP